MQAEAAKAGITLKLTPLDPATLGERRTKKSIPLQITTGQLWVNDVEYMLATSFVKGAALNYANYTNAELEEEKRLNEGPFYALGPVRTWVIVSQVGLAINTRLEVLDEADRPIPGLYAAGGSGQAGLTLSGHGHGLGWAFTSGRLAAREAAGRLSN